MTGYDKLTWYPIPKQGKETQIMDKIIGDFLDQLKVGRKQTYKNLALYPLLSTYSADLEYLLENSDLVNLGGEKRSVTIMMSDLRGFTALALNDELLHASIFARAHGRNTGIADSRTERFSRRRRNRGI